MQLGMIGLGRMGANMVRRLVRGGHQCVVYDANIHLRQLFADDPTRGERLATEAVGLYFDYSKHRITDETIRLLVALAEACGLRHRIDAMFRGNRINRTEDRAVLHGALRAPKGQSIIVDGEDVVPQVHAVLDRMADFTTQVRRGTWKGYTGKRIRHVMNIGIGGSDLGPVMVYEALKAYSTRDTGDKRPALVLSASPPGDNTDSVRCHCLLPDAEPARPASRFAHGKCVRPDRSPGVREDSMRK
jgi:NAD(P)-dependent dehydrogenase (short-subunit alcohol dehydrogenase family)